MSHDDILRVLQNSALARDTLDCISAVATPRAARHRQKRVMRLLVKAFRKVRRWQHAIGSQLKPNM